jgi:lipoyl(octanoyl) transferase
VSVALDTVVVKKLGCAQYVPTWHAMREYTRKRDESSADELWLLEHPPVYTLGQGADPRFGPADGSEASVIPIVQSDRGGEITYHGPGQAVVYTLIDLSRRGIKVKPFVSLLEDAVLDLLDGRGGRRPGAPGVYVGSAKIAALGIRVSRGRAYHGVALNVDMDLSPFRAIAPCGIPGLAVTQMRALGARDTVGELGERLAGRIIARLEHA